MEQTPLVQGPTLLHILLFNPIRYICVNIFYNAFLPLAASFYTYIYAYIYLNGVSASLPQ